MATTSRSPEWSPRDADAVRTLLPDALRRPAAEGARLAALHYLHQLLEARAAADTPERLHQVRVALRRLRATLRDHARVLDGVSDRRVRRAMRALARATGAQRDSDVQRAWLAAEAATFDEAAQDQAQQLRERLAPQDDATESPETEIDAAFARYLEPHIEPLFERLSVFTLPHRVGRAMPTVPFARHLAQRLERGGVRLQRRLLQIDGIDDVESLHAARLELKRHRALLAPFAKTLPALGAWFQHTTRGQDLLGAARDAHLVARRARRAGFPTLAVAARGVCRSHHAAFLSDWHAMRDHAQRDGAHPLLTDAIDALRTHFPPLNADGLPLEIERKFLLRGCPPEAAAIGPLRIEQGWIPGESLRERLRRTTAADGRVRCTRTVKLGPSGARIEVEEDSTPVLFAALWPLTRDARVRKLRHVVPEGAYRWEIDVFLDRDLVLAEIELDAPDQEITIPEWLEPWLVRDVTGEVAYLNAALARPEP